MTELAENTDFPGVLLPSYTGPSLKKAANAVNPAKIAV
jgi:hypothetical protein